MTLGSEWKKEEIREILESWKIDDNYEIRGLIPPSLPPTIKTTYGSIWTSLEE